MESKLAMSYNLLVVLGPTASGKTRLAVRLAQHLGGEIISADSRQVYRGMNLGTGKDLAEYQREGTPVPYHLVDILEPREAFSVFAFQKLFLRCFTEIHARSHLPILVGGTGLYLDAVLSHYDLPEVPSNPQLRERLADKTMEALSCHLADLNPLLHNRTDLDDRDRLLRAIEIASFKKDQKGRKKSSGSLRSLVLGTRIARAELHQRIGERLEARLKAGLVEEVKQLSEGVLDWGRLDAFGLEYRYVSRYLRGELSREAMIDTLRAKIRQFAKRQETWFRGMERRGVPIHWVDPEAETEEILAIVRKGT